MRIKKIIQRRGEERKRKVDVDGARKMEESEESRRCGRRSESGGVGWSVTAQHRIEYEESIIICRGYGKRRRGYE